MSKEGNNDTKQKILKVAEEYFARDGYQGVSLSFLAEKVGISKPALYHYFTNKEELYAEILLNAVSNLKNEIDRSIDHELPLEDRFRLVLTNYINFIFKNKNILLLLKQNACLHNEKMLENLHLLIEEVRRLLRPLLQEILETKGGSKIDPDTAARMLFGAVNALVGEELLHNKEREVDVKKIVNYFVYILFDK